MPAALQYPVEVVEVDVGEQRAERGALRRPLLGRLPHAIYHDSRFQVAADQLEHLLVGDPPCEPGHQRVVLDSVKEAIEVQIDGVLEPLGDVALGATDRIMGRAPGTKAEATLREAGVEYGHQHLREGLLDQPIQGRRHPQLPLPAGGLWNRDPPGGLRSVGARVEHRPDLGPVVVQPGAKLFGLQPIDAGSTGVALDASERRRQIAPGEELLPEVLCDGGVRLRLAWRREAALLFAGSFRLHLERPLREGPAGAGLAAVASASTGALCLGFAFGPSRRTTSPLLRPLLTPAGCPAASRRPGSGDKPRRGRHPGRPPGISQDTFPAHPPHLRCGRLMATGFALSCRLALAAPPPMRFVSLGSRFRLHLPSHPASRRRGWLRLVVGAISSTEDFHPRASWHARRQRKRARMQVACGLS